MGGLDDDYFEDNEISSITHPADKQLNLLDFDQREADELKELEREQKKYKQIVQKYRVLGPAEIEAMLKKQEMTPQQRQAAIIQQPLQVSAEEAKDELSRKRTREQMMSSHEDIKLQGGANDSISAKIQEHIIQIRDRVLKGETLNQFKKEVGNIALLVDKSEGNKIFD
mmetsp:Transcript_32971/g.50436  ORF Transcript_32971/g.50436 Transcript_32971/m.50436 type:complete len:169 (-) Transcript_32971:698-1204(-)